MKLLGLFFLGGILLCLSSLSFAAEDQKSASAVVQDEKATASSSEKEASQVPANNQVDVSSDSVANPAENESASAPASKADAPSAESDMDGQKAMEQALQSTMLDEAMSYYPIVREFSLESKDGKSKIVIAYDQPAENDKIRMNANPQASDDHAEIFINTPLIQKNESAILDGDGDRVARVVLSRNESLSAKLGAEAKFFFVGKIVIPFLKPSRWKVNQVPGLITIELSDKKDQAEEENTETVKKSEVQDIVYQAPEPQATNQILGQSFANERQYEQTAYSDNHQSLLDQLNDSSMPLSLGSATNYGNAVSEAAIKSDMRYRYPDFGSLDYWKKHVTGAVSNTLQLMKKRRNQHPMLAEAPGLALVYDRKGPAHVKLGYNIQREFPFFYGKLGHLAPMDGFMRQDILGGVVYKTNSPWLYSVQNRLGIAASENTSSAAKFGDRLNTYSYEAGQAIRYSLRRGYLQLGSGFRWQGGEGTATGFNSHTVNNDLTTYLSMLWVRRFSKKWTGRVEYNYMHTFEYKPQPAPDTNVHKMYLGLDYQFTKQIKLSPSFGWAFYDGEAFAGWVGELKYNHKLSERDYLTASYSTDFIKAGGFDFGADSLTSSQGTFNSNDSLIRYQLASIYYEHDLTASTTFVSEARYRKERLFELSGGDKLDEYRLSVGLNHRIHADWALELRYALIYLDASRLGATAVRTDAGNTEHNFYFRVLRYFGKNVK